MKAAALNQQHLKTPTKVFLDGVRCLPLNFMEKIASRLDQVLGHNNHVTASTLLKFIISKMLPGLEHELNPH